MLAQDHPAHAMELIVVDGDSTDGTVARVREIASGDPRVRVLSNPARFVGPGLNLGIAAARGDVIVRADGHCAIPRDYVSTCVAMLRAGEGECVGGPVRAEGDTPVAQAIALAMSTPFGVGGASFRWAGTRREVDHLPFGAWRREVFERLGGFDEALVRNQDDEFSDRLRRAGGRIVMHPGIGVAYWSRRSFAGLWRQYWGYGFYKVRVIARRGGMPYSVRQLVPATWLVCTTAAILAGAIARDVRIPALALAPYAAFLVFATAWVASRKRVPAAFLLPAALFTMQAAYGLGFLSALARPARGAAAVPVIPTFVAEERSAA